MHRGGLEIGIVIRLPTAPKVAEVRLSYSSTPQTGSFV